MVNLLGGRAASYLVDRDLVTKPLDAVSHECARAVWSACTNPPRVATNYFRHNAETIFAHLSELGWWKG